MPSDSIQRWRYYHRLLDLTSAAFSGDDAALDQPVVADRARRKIFKLRGIANLARLHSTNRGQTRADDFRRDKECHSIYNPRAQRRTGESGAPFDQHAAPSAMPKFEHQPIQLDRAVGYRNCKHFDAAALILLS